MKENIHTLEVPERNPRVQELQNSLSVVAHFVNPITREAEAVGFL